MKLKYRLNELKKEMYLLVDFLTHEDTLLSMDEKLSICAEISRLKDGCETIEAMKLRDAERECDTYTIEQPSKLNDMVKRKRKVKPPIPLPKIERTWQTFN